MSIKSERPPGLGGFGGHVRPRTRLDEECEASGRLDFFLAQNACIEVIVEAAQEEASHRGEVCSLCIGRSEKANRVSSALKHLQCHADKSLELEDGHRCVESDLSSEASTTHEIGGSRRALEEQRADSTISETKMYIDQPSRSDDVFLANCLPQEHVQWAFNWFGGIQDNSFQSQGTDLYI